MSRFHGRTLRASICMAGVFLLAAHAAAAEPNLKYVKPLTLPALDKQELVAAPLDSDVYDVARNGFPDLRLFDSADQEIPFVLRKAATQRDETTRETWTARRAPSAKPLPNDGLEITLELDRKEPTPNGLRLVSPLHNFEHRVQVEFSSDGQAWQPLVSDGLIFDYARYIDVRHDTVHWTLPASIAPEGIADGDKTPEDAPLRRVRITINDVSEEQESQLVELTRRLRGETVDEKTESVTIDRRPFRIERIDFFRDVPHPRVTGEWLTDYPLSGFEITTDAKAKRTEITVASRRDPLTSLSLVTEAKNFSRTAVVEVERDQVGSSGWRAVRAGNISRIDFRDLDQKDLTISISETRQPRYRIVIENRDSPPLAISGIQARGPVYEIVFLAEPKAGYRLAYGGAGVKSPDYDTAALVASLAAGYVPLVAKLGAQEVFAEDVVIHESFYQRLINDTRFLMTAIAVLIVVLGFGLYQASRRVNSQAG